ncbi:hypothetical protein G6F56_012393 [Rhizopus delemar]|nr:hypothetical protein G6F56_012393 [Rhizopus delemar]
MNNDSYHIFKSLHFPHQREIQEPTETKPKTAAAFLSFSPLEFRLGPMIAYGGYSVVHKVFTASGTKAIKVIETSKMSDEDLGRFRRELVIWRSLCHPRIVNLQRVIKHATVYYLLCDYCPSTLKGPVSIMEAKRIFREICQAVHYLHLDRKVLHKDLKLENVLLDQNGNVKLCDFGLAVYQNEPWKGPLLGTEVYMPPEKESNCPKSDIWSLGVLLYALIVGRLPPKELDHLDDYDAQELISDCLQIDPGRRPSIDQVLKYDWLQF